LDGPDHLAASIGFCVRHGGFEGIMRNYRGELAECTQSNLFIVKNGSR
jgi:branched-subunit amino acid aminotransferase/4-amino-4-deoxychorismate lyase